MKKHKTQNTECMTDEVQFVNGSSSTSVTTTYARACIILLALNFCLTGYVMLNVMDIQSGQSDTVTAPAVSAAGSSRSAPVAPLEVSPRERDPAPLETPGTETREIPR